MTLRARRLKPSHVSPAVPRFSSACRAKYVRCRIERQLAELNDFICLLLPCLSRILILEFSPARQQRIALA